MQRLVTNVSVKLTGAALRAMTKTTIQDFFLFKVAIVTLDSTDAEDSTFYFLGAFGRWLNLDQLASKFQLDEIPAETDEDEDD